MFLGLRGYSCEYRTQQMKPIMSWLPELSDGVMIVVQGTVEKEKDGKFLLDFCHLTNATAALRICVTFASQIVLKLQMSGDTGFSFRRGFQRTGVLRFEVIVLVSDGNFKISLNGCHVCEAPHLIPLTEINRLEANGNVLLERIFCQRPSGIDQQAIGDHKASEKLPKELDTQLPADPKLSAGKDIREAKPVLKVIPKNSDLLPEPPHLTTPFLAGTGASSETNFLKADNSTKNRGANISEADVSNRHSDVDLPGACSNVDLSSGDAPQPDNDFRNVMLGFMQNPATGPPDEPAVESESLRNPATPVRFELPYAYASPQTPAVPVSSAVPYPPTGYDSAQNHMKPNLPEAPYPHGRYAASQNPVILGQSRAPFPYPGYIPHQNTAIQGNANALFLYSGQPCYQNPVTPGYWNTPYPCPSSTSNQNPTTTCQTNAPLPLHPYQAYTPNLYPPLPSDSDVPCHHSGREIQQPNPVIPASGPPPYNPYYSPHWPNYNQQPGTDTVPTAKWTHSNVKFFPEGLKLNQVINIYGEFLQNSSGFSVRMLNGDTEDANVFLDMIVSFPDRMVSRRRKMYSRWSQVENSLSHFPFQIGKPFHVVIVCYYNLFRVFAGETHLFDFQASMNLSEITSVWVFGMVTAVNIA